MSKLDKQVRAIIADHPVGKVYSSLEGGDRTPETLEKAITALLKVEVAKAKIEVLTKFKSDYADELSVDAYEELIEIISKLQAEASNE